MDVLFLIGQIACLAGLAYGGWLCFNYAARYDADAMRSDEAASRNAQVRGHVEATCPRLDLAA